ncbi:MACRO domain containing protein 2 [Echinococcus multilocularis]|uniref:MACRO domain containing protein 2 n=1 Tax=Echinococcus multilocularis TaxID=6211 RepID=A0A068YMA3_ECHMU|nr:MACRO domain containing protein 2 [Echinococcus multilocularis]
MLIYEADVHDDVIPSTCTWLVFLKVGRRRSVHSHSTYHWTSHQLQMHSRSSSACLVVSLTSIEERDGAYNGSMFQRLSFITGDITRLAVDAIVNAANSSLLGGGGVDGAIHRAAGPGLLKECRGLGGCAVGSAKITGGYNLPAKYVIHCVGPSNGSAEALRSCYDTAMRLCTENGIKSVAFPCIATGVYGFPNAPAAQIAVKTVWDYLEKHDDVSAWLCEWERFDAAKTLRTAVEHLST